MVHTIASVWCVCVSVTCEHLLYLPVTGCLCVCHVYLLHVFCMCLSYLFVSRVSAICMLCAHLSAVCVVCLSCVPVTCDLSVSGVYVVWVHMWWLAVPMASLGQQGALASSLWLSLWSFPRPPSARWLCPWLIR